MTHRDQLIKILEESRIDYGFSGGTNLLVGGVLIGFGVRGELNKIEPENYGDCDELDNY